MNKVHVILDEFASIGHLPIVDDALDKFRYKGVRLQLYLQSLAQAKVCFPEGQDQMLMSNCSQIFAGVNDNGTADFVSARLGEQTIILNSGGSQRGTSRQWTFDRNSGGSTGNSGNTNSNWSQSARKLLQASEVLSLHPRQAITFTPGARPIMTTLLRYYEEPWLSKRAGLWRRMCEACGTLVVSAILCAAALGLAVLLTLGAQMENQPRPQSFPSAYGQSTPDVPAYNVFQER